MQINLTEWIIFPGSCLQGVRASRCRDFIWKTWLTGWTSSLHLEWRRHTQRHTLWFVKGKCSWEENTYSSLTIIYTFVLLVWRCIDFLYQGVLYRDKAHTIGGWKDVNRGSRGDHIQLLQRTWIDLPYFVIHHHFFIKNIWSGKILEMQVDITCCLPACLKITPVTMHSHRAVCWLKCMSKCYKYKSWFMLWVATVLWTSLTCKCGASLSDPQQIKGSFLFSNLNTTHTFTVCGSIMYKCMHSIDYTIYIGLKKKKKVKHWEYIQG